MKLTYLSARLKLRLSELAWYEGKKADYAKLLKELQEEFSSQESGWLKAELFLLLGYDLRSDQTEEALNAATNLGQTFLICCGALTGCEGVSSHRQHFGSAGEIIRKRSKR